MGFKPPPPGLDGGLPERKVPDIGWPGARLDDLLTYVPARLTALLLRRRRF
jgi:cobalamin biosynthesis protein CobD/CbiB